MKALKIYVIGKYLGLCISLSLFAIMARAEYVSGSTCVPASTPVQYSLNGLNSSVTYTWHVSGGTINGSSTYTATGYSAYIVYITWSTGSGHSVWVTWSSGSTSTLYVNSASTFYAGSITSTNPLTINYNSTPGSINCSAATGGYCTATTYTYQWQSSPNNVTWSNISGANSQNYSCPALTTTTYFRRMVTSSATNTSVYSNVATIFVNPQLSPGSISNGASQPLTYNTSPGQITGTAATGGGCSGSYSYQWQQSTDNVNFSNVSGATSQNYTPGNLTGTIYYRRRVICGSETQYSNALAFVVQIYGGVVSPSSATINYRSSPGQLTGTAAAGGNCSGSYSYQWQSSLDNSNFSDISGATSLNYTPGNLTLSTFYRRRVTCGSETGYSNTATISLYPQVEPGLLVPGAATIASGTSPGMLTANPASGGNCSGSYSYQWQQSTDGTNFSDIAGATGLTYSPGNLSSTKYYRRKVTCGSVVVYSNVSNIMVGTVNGAYINFIRQRDITKAGVPSGTGAAALTNAFEVKQTTQFFDGIGRPNQTVVRQASPLGKDLVTTTHYDEVGREQVQYMPYISTGTGGDFRSFPVTEQNSFNASQFSGENFYYSQIKFEPSPLNRVLRTSAQGSSWTGSNRGIDVQYQVNDVLDSVRKWTIGYSIGSIPTTASTYGPGQLTKTATSDEQGKQVIEYQDGEGRVILKKVQLWNSPADGPSGWLNTYYIYDDFGNLRFVIQPLGVDAIKSNWTVTSAVANELCFRYDYDSRSRMIVKKIPGAGEVWMVYDFRDRMVMVQDSLERSQGKWLYTQYDSLNRPTRTGLWTTSGDRAYHQNLAASSINYPVPSGTYEILTETYYDNYWWTASSGSGLDSALITTNINGTNFFTAYNTNPDYAVQIASNYIVRGQVTGTKVKVLGSSIYEFTLSIMDDHKRPIQTKSKNITGGLDIATIQYSFSGAVLRSHWQHQKLGHNTQNYQVLTKMSYDAMGRLTIVKKNFNNLGDKTISQSSYDELSQLRNKTLGGGIDSLIYDYNVRGWLLGMNRDFVKDQASNYFGFELGYDKTSTIISGTSYANPQYNGNIEGTVWKSRGDNQKRKYDFTYDNLNRLISADFNQYTGGAFNKSANVNFSVSSLSYDANGNILNMTQWGMKLNASSIIDSLIYGYNATSNRLLYVTDKTNDSASRLGDFKEFANNTSQDYYYDGNGNLTQDNNKRIGSITYNCLNLPSLITLTNKGTIAYIYDAAGVKLQKIVTEGTRIDTTLYLFGFEYKDDTLQSVSHEEGRIRPDTLNPSPANFFYDYFEKDHLGNVRMVLTEQAQRDMYPAATMETSNRSLEQTFYGPDPLSNVEDAKPTGFDSDPNNQKVARLNYGAEARRIGPNMLLKVMATDTVDITVDAFYKSAGQNNSNSSIASEMVAALIGAFGGSTSTTPDPTHGFTIGQRNLTTFTTAGYSGISALKNSDPNGNTNKPKAYLNWILFDEQFNMVASSSGTRQVNMAADTKGTMTFTNNVVGANGYLYIYVSNESPMDVFFDNLQVTHRRGRILEETHYYPFGLAMAGISSKAASSLENRRKFNDGTEFNTELGLNWYETDYRSYDPQIGRFYQIDELTEFDFNWSPYVYAHNNPILLNDPLGLTADSTGKPGFTPDNPEILPEVVVTARRHKSVGQPGLAESLIPIWGSGRAAIDDFQNGRWGWGIFNTVMAISDVFLLKSAITAVGKLIVKEAVQETAKEGVYVITTRSGRYVGQSKNFLKRLVQHFGKGGKLSGQQLEKALLHEMPGSTKLEREVYEQYLIDNHGIDNLINARNPMGGRREEFNKMIDVVIEKFGLPK